MTRRFPLSAAVLSRIPRARHPALGAALPWAPPAPAAALRRPRPQLREAWPGPSLGLSLQQSEKRYVPKEGQWQPFHPAAHQPRVR